MNPTNLRINPKDTRTIQMADNNTYISLWILSEISYLKMLVGGIFFVLPLMGHGCAIIYNNALILRNYREITYSKRFTFNFSISYFSTWGFWGFSCRKTWGPQAEGSGHLLHITDCLHGEHTSENQIRTEWHDLGFIFIRDLFCLNFYPGNQEHFG